jgi:hypothetical protein
MTTTIERKYVLRRIGKGDYLLPSNDGATLWRIRTYEDGPSHGLDWPRDLTFWGLWKWDAPIDTTGRAKIDPDDPDHWEYYDGTYKTRAEAIRAVLAASADD